HKLSLGNVLRMGHCCKCYTPHCSYPVPCVTSQLCANGWRIASSAARRTQSRLPANPKRLLYSQLISMLHLPRHQESPKKLSPWFRCKPSHRKRKRHLRQNQIPPRFTHKQRVVL